MRVTWTEIFDSGNYDSVEDYHVWSEDYTGEVIGAVRSWGTTRLVVMLNTGRIREVDADLVKKVIEI